MKLMRIFKHALLILYALTVIYPLFIMIISSFKSQGEIFLHPFSFPKTLMLSNYEIAWTKGHFGVYFWNSVFVSLLSIVLILFVTSMAAYVLARFHFKGVNGIVLFFLAGMMLPVRLAILPIFEILKNIHLLNTLWGLIVVYVSMGIPFSVYLLIDFYRNIPKEIEESAYVDGAGYFQIYLYITLPIMRPALATVAIFNFISIWNDFFFPLVLLRSERLFTLPLGLFNFFGVYGNQWNYLFAGLSLTTVPIIIAYIILSKQFIKGLTIGAVKG